MRVKVICVFVFSLSPLSLLSLILSQERFQVKNPPHTYIQKLRGYLDPAVTRKVSVLIVPNQLFLSLFLPLSASSTPPGYPTGPMAVERRPSGPEK